MFEFDVPKRRNKVELTRIKPLLRVKRFGLKSCKEVSVIVSNIGNAHGFETFK